MKEYFNIDVEPYEVSQFGQEKRKVYLTKEGNTYYIGDIRKFEDGEPMSYLRMDKLIKVSHSLDVRELNKEELIIVDKELNSPVIEDDLMVEPRTYRDKIL